MDRENKGDTTDNQCSPSIWKQMRDTESSVKERPKFETDVRVEGVPQDAILEDEGQMKDINKTLTGGGPAWVPNLRVCKHHCSRGGARRRRKGGLTSCRGTVKSAW